MSARMLADELTIDPQRGFVVDGAKAEEKTVVGVAMGSGEILNGALVPQDFVGGALVDA